MLLYTDTVHIQQLIFYIKVLQNRVGFAQMPFILIFTFLNPPPKKNPTSYYIEKNLTGGIITYLN